ncbi:MAG: sulfatase-like hydrolase/transferase [Gammaproteobacteria bacterium]|nr:sulfatase-like hydrolase/transferase [Gammaproteobacteria bacterium]
MLFVDDLGYRDIGVYGGPVSTPILDGLAAGGVRFTDFHSGSGVCSSSRAVVMTGRHHIRAGIYHVINDRSHDMHLLEREVTIAELLKSAGYSTAHIGKWHMGLPFHGRDKPTPDRHGFDYWFVTENNAWPSHRNPVNFVRNGTRVGELEGYSSHLMVDEAIVWLDARRFHARAHGKEPDQPFFLNIWFHEPHAPIAAPDEVVAKYGDLDDPAAIYSGTIDNTDRAIARLVEKLKVDDEFDNTLIVYASDNGSYRQDRVGELRGKKGSNFEGGHRVPGIFHWPGGIARGRVETEPAGVVDLLPTFAGLLGIDPPSGVHLDGADLSPLLTGRGEFKREQPLFWFSPDAGAAVRDGRYSLVAFPGYRLPKDREAMNDLYEQVRAVLEAGDDPALTHGDLWTQMFNGFDNPEAERLRIQFILLNQFRESWIPALKAGGFDRFQLFDLEQDISQQTDKSAEQPETFARLKQTLLDIHASVMADGPDWTQSVVRSD